MVTKPAGFWKRFLASLLDGIIIGIPLAVISYWIKGDWGGDAFTSIINVLYFWVVPVIWSGYTVGKKIIGIRIVKINGEKLGFGAMFLRSIVASLLYGITLGFALLISAIMVAAREDKRAIHDFIAGTYVTTESPASS
ncbi:putative RDD family membrane protein YckC [Anoxybacillus tepidamans]|uniref:Putative RDD family membrane protein YckC n=1 Tax=Anoxybacteroides tepidamans TaxID=265948 RepID=A0A7W8IQU0_9BACL|nr:RDD family protein [Anoxybacillus tepidamans]MBB5324947.1 putative RDD family membrane protein YckC [Anoxybacillus tepidamans]